MFRILTTVALFMAVIGYPALAQTANNNPEINRMKTVEHLKDFQIIEFRRYTIKPGQRQHFAEYFDSYFPDAFEQMGAIVFGEFCDRKNPDGFTWLRGFHTKYDRAIVNGAFYNGPLWREHSKRMNDLMVDSDNVLLLRPLKPEREIPVLPAVDPVNEKAGAQGVVVALIFTVKSGRTEEFVKEAESSFVNYRSSGIREAGVLVTAEIPNNYPQLPVRTDGPHLVWLGIVEDDQTLQSRLKGLFDKSLSSLASSELLKTAPELVILDPTNRSRLRWINDNERNAD